MFTFIKLSGATIVAVAIAACIGLVPHHAYAASSANYNIDPICADPASGKALFVLTNKENAELVVDYVNNDTGAAGAVTLGANASVNTYTDYKAGVNNQIAFTAVGSDTKTTNANTAPCVIDETTPAQGSNPAGTCTDVSKDASLLKVDWNNDSTITVLTENSMPICKSVELYYSTYRMPDTYVGQGEFNKSAYPQNLEQSYRFMLWQGTKGIRLANVPAPDYCSNTQADIYYGPEIVGIDADGYGYHADGSKIANGHGTQNIKSQVFFKDASRCVGGKGGATGANGANGSGGAGALTALPTVLPATGGDANTALTAALAGLGFAGLGLLGAGIRTLRK